MAKPKTAVIISTTRMPFFDEPATNAWVPSKNGSARSIEHLRLVCMELQMLAYLEKNSKDMLDELVWWASALKVARAA